MTTIWLSHRRPEPTDCRLTASGFKAEWYAHGRELRCRWFGTYRDAIDFAGRKVGKAGSIIDGVPTDLRTR